MTLEQAILNAPFSGTITVVDISPGDMVAAGQGILTLAELTRLQAEAIDLSEEDCNRVELGQEALVYVAALDREIEGKVKSITRRAPTRGQNAECTVVVELSEQRPGLRRGMSVAVRIATEY
jgi:HlyD family secretion protein